MPSRRIVSVALTLVLSTAIAFTTSATQDVTDQSPNSRDRMRQSRASGQQDVARSVDIYVVKHAAADELTDVLRQTMPEVRVTCDVRTNSLILSGDDASLKSALDLLRQLDVPVSDEAQSGAAEINCIKSPIEIDGDVLATISQAIAGIPDPTQRGRSGRLSYDGNLLIYAGSKKVASVIDDVLHKIAEARSEEEPMVQEDEPLRLYFYFIAASLDSQAKAPGELPESLTPVTTALRENGMYAPYLLAPMMINADPRGGDYSLRAVTTAENFTGTLSIEVTGSVDLHPNDQRVDLFVQTRINGESPGLAGANVRHLFQVESNLVVAMNNYVVLAASPGSNEDRTTIILVIRVERGAEAQ
jgi:hypothetical protein